MPCTGLFYSRRIGRSPQGDGRSAERRRHLHRRAVADDDPRRRQAHRPRRQVLGRRAAGGDAGRDRARADRRPFYAHSRSSRSTSYTVGRVRREFANQSSIGLMVTATKRAARATAALSPRQRLHSAASIGTCASSSATRSPATCAASGVHGEPDAIDAFSRTAATTSSVRIRPAPRSTRRARSLAGSAGVDRHQQDRRPARPLQFECRRSSRRASTSTISGSCGAPTSARWATGCRFATRSRTAGSAAATSTSISMPAWNFDGDRLFSGGNVNAQRQFVNNWSVGGGVRLSSRSGSTIAQRAAGPGVYSGGYKDVLVVARHRHRGARVAELVQRRRQQRRGQPGSATTDRTSPTGRCRRSR